MANRALSSILEAKLIIPRETLVLQDRGLFDALAFFKLLHVDGFISGEALGEFLDYFANPRWTRIVDLVILFRTSPTAAMERDLAKRISDRSGVITNETTLHNLSRSYDFVRTHYKDRFLVTSLPTTDKDMETTAREAIRLIQHMPAFETLTEVQG